MISQNIIALSVRQRELSTALTIYTIDVYTNSMKHQTIIRHKRVNVTLPEHTLELLNSVAKKGQRSGFVNRAVHFYIQEIGQSTLREQLRKGAIVHASRDLSLAKDWFPLEEELWQKKDNK